MAYGLFKVWTYDLNITRLNSWDDTNYPIWWSSNSIIFNIINHLFYKLKLILNLSNFKLYLNWKLRKISM